VIVEKASSPRPAAVKKRCKDCTKNSSVYSLWSRNPFQLYLVAFVFIKTTYDISIDFLNALLSRGFSPHGAFMSLLDRWSLCSGNHQTPRYTEPIPEPKGHSALTRIGKANAGLKAHRDRSSTNARMTGEETLEALQHNHCSASREWCQALFLDSIAKSLVIITHSLDTSLTNRNSM
jgi:hypothetical protein